MSRRDFLAGFATAMLGLGIPPVRGAAPTRFRPEDFGAAGDGRTDDTGALRACLAAALRACSPDRPVEVVIAAQHLVTDTLALRALPGPLMIRGVGNAAGLIAGGNGAFTCLHVRPGASRAPPVQVAASAPVGARSLRLVGAGGIKPNDIVSLSNATGYRRDRRQCLLEVASSDGSMLHLTGPLPFDVDTRNPATVHVYVMAPGLTVDNLGFDRGVATGDASGLRIEFCRSPVVTNIRSRGFAGRGTSGQTYGPCLGGRYARLFDEGSGSAAQIDAIKFWVVSDAEIVELESRRSAGFGIGITFVSGSRLERLSVENANGRGLKLFGACSNRLARLRVVGSSKTGLSISSGSSYNDFSEVQAIGNRESGVWLNGTDNSYNRFSSVLSKGNGIDLMVAATAPLVDRDNHFKGVSGMGRTSIAPSSHTVIEP